MIKNDEKREKLKRTQTRGLWIVTIGAVTILGLAVATLSDPVAAMTTYAGIWGIIACIGASISFAGMIIINEASRKESDLLMDDILSTIDRISEEIDKQKEN